MSKRVLIISIVAVFTVCVFAEKNRLSLDGRWAFCYVDSASLPEELRSFYMSEYDCSSWDSISVPSNWEIAGKKIPEYGGDVKHCHGLYRRAFAASTLEDGNRLFLRFDGVLFAYELYINGHYVGYHASAFCRSEWDITDYLSNEGDNVIAIDVSTRSRNKAYRFDLNDCWALTGIFRSVILFEQPLQHIVSTSFTSHVTGDKAEVEYTAKVVADKSAKLSVSLIDRQGKQVWSDSQSGQSTFKFHSSVFSCFPWTAETPYLYTLVTCLTAFDGTLLDIREEKVGIREVSIDKDVLLLNGKPLTLRGVCMNELHPSYGRALPEEQLWEDFRLMKAANINYIRTAHYPFQPRFHELCDEFGFYVVCEIPFGYGDSNLTDTAYRDELFRRAEATISLNRNHPSIIIWSIGNENPYTPIVEQTIEHVRDIDPSRPRAIPGYKVSNTFLRDSTTSALSLFTLHYQSIDKIEEMASHHLKPILLTEYSHAFGLSFDALESQQAMIRRNPSIVGGSVWVWADQALLKKRTPEECRIDTIPQGVWLDSVHYYDSYTDKGTDGIVFANRYPQEDYWQVRKLYSPVWITDSVLSIKKGNNRLCLNVENRHDFLSLKGFVLKYAVNDWKRNILSGSVRLSAAPHSSERVSIKCRLPHTDDALLSIEVVAPDSSVIYEHTVRLIQVKPFNYVDKITEGNVEPLNVAVSADGMLILKNVDGDTLICSPLLLRVGRKPSINTINLIKRGKLDSYWDPYILSPTIISVNELSSSDTARFLVHACWIRMGVPEQEYYEGDIDICQIKDGSVAVSYDLHSRHATGTILECGLTLALPERLSIFTWLGKGIFSSTPHKSVLNERGIWALHKNDIRLIGNRSDVSVASAISREASSGIAFVPASFADYPVGGNVSVENIGGRFYITDTRVLSSYGTKLSRMMVQQKAHKVKHVSGRFILTSFADNDMLYKIFLPLQDIKPEQPFLKVYDH